jgi:hypothetical protein
MKYDEHNFVHVTRDREIESQSRVTLPCQIPSFSSYFLACNDGCRRSVKRCASCLSTWCWSVDESASYWRRARWLMLILMQGMALKV